MEVQRAIRHGVTQLAERIMPRKRKSGRKKAKDLPHHAKKRALQRYGITLTNDDLSTIVKKIQKRQAQLLEKQSNRVALYRVSWQDRPMLTVYDCQREQVVTFLAKEHFQYDDG